MTTAYGDEVLNARRHAALLLASILLAQIKKQV
jgi:hypothetical protein